MNIVFARIFCTFLFLANVALADNVTEKKLKDLKLKAELQEKMLLQSQKEIVNLKQELGQLDVKIITNLTQEDKLRTELKKIDSSINEMNSQILVNKGKISILNQNFKARVRAIYKMQKSSTVFDYFANSITVVEVLKKKRFLTDIADSDKQLLDAVNEAISALQEGVEKLASLRTKRQETLSTLTLLLASFKRDKSFQEDLLKRKEERKKSIKIALAELKSAAEDLEKSLTSLIEKHTPRVGMFLLRAGSLLFPVKGEIEHGFGKRKHQEFSDFVFSKGVEIKTEENASVKATASGKVLLARELPGYGLVLIIDHGSRIYTLYARIKNLLRKVGDEIEVGQKLAEVEDDRNFYFELRKMGKAIDPAPFLSR